MPAGLKGNMIGLDGGDESLSFTCFIVTQEKAHWNILWNDPTYDITYITALGNKDGECKIPGFHSSVKDSSILGYDTVSISEVTNVSEDIAAF
jgi:hypothetical protein